MKVNGEMTNKMDLEERHIIMEIFMLDIGMIMKYMDMENIFINKVLLILVIGKIV
jgi:hypothetical protein